MVSRIPGFGAVSRIPAPNKRAVVRQVFTDLQTGDLVR